jgi:putative transposase
VPPESADLAPLIGLVVNRTIQADGITFMGLTYRDPKLAEFRRTGHMGQEWMVKVDPLDLSALLVLDAEGQGWARVPCQQMHLIEGLTLQMWMDVVRAAKDRTAHGQRVARSTLLRAREALVFEARKMGHKPHGKITTAQYRWIEGEINKSQYEFEIDADGDNRKSATPRSRKTRTKNTEVTADLGPTLIDPASRAGGHGVAEREVPGANLERAQQELLEEVADGEESDRLQRFREESARAANLVLRPRETHTGDAAQDTGKVSLVPTAEDMAEDIVRNTDQPAMRSRLRARQGSTIESPLIQSTDSISRQRPRGLVDEDDAEHWNQ